MTDKPESATAALRHLTRSAGSAGGNGGSSLESQEGAFCGGIEASAAGEAARHHKWAPQSDGTHRCCRCSCFRRLDLTGRGWKRFYLMPGWQEWRERSRSAMPRCGGGG